MPVSKSAASSAGCSRHCRPPRIWPNVFKGILSFFSPQHNLYEKYSWLFGVEKGSMDQCLIMVTLLNYYRLINLHPWCSDKRYIQHVCFVSQGWPSATRLSQKKRRLSQIQARTVVILLICEFPQASSGLCGVSLRLKHRSWRTDSIFNSTVFFFLKLAFWSDSEICVDVCHWFFLPNISYYCYWRCSFG